jgi:hypothetical protein
VLVLTVGRGHYSVAEAAFMPAVGLCILLWLKTRPASVPEHLASVEYVQGHTDRPDAPTTPFYLAWCDCGWLGDERRELTRACIPAAPRRRCAASGERRTRRSLPARAIDARRLDDPAAAAASDCPQRP